MDLNIAGAIVHQATLEMPQNGSQIGAIAKRQIIEYQSAHDSLQKERRAEAPRLKSNYPKVAENWDALSMRAKNCWFSISVPYISFQPTTRS